MYNEQPKVEVTVGRSESHGHAISREESKLSRLKALTFEAREASMSLNSRVREMKVFLCGDVQEKIREEKEGKDIIQYNGELSVLIDVTRETLHEINRIHDYMSELESALKP